MPTRRIVKGTVFSRTAGKLVVVPADSCEKASSCGEGCGSCSGKRPAARLTVNIPDADRFATGSSVEVTTWVVNEALGALIVFGIPLVFTITALGVRYVINPAAVESASSLIGAAGAFTLGGIVVALIDRMFRKRHPSTVVNIGPHTAPTCGGDEKNG